MWSYSGGNAHQRMPDLGRCTGVEGGSKISDPKSARFWRGIQFFSDGHIVIFREISTIKFSGPGVRDTLNMNMGVGKSLFGAQIMRYGAQRECSPVEPRDAANLSP